MARNARSLSIWNYTYGVRQQARVLWRRRRRVRFISEWATSCVEPFATLSGPCNHANMPESTLIAEPLARIEAAAETKDSLPNRERNPLSYGLAVCLSAFLLFQVQLIVGKYILPLFGGAPAVWNTCMLCFQFLLLAGYSYAHFLRTKFRLREQGRIHLGLLVIAVAVVAIQWGLWGSPFTPGVSWRPSPEDNPVAKILELLFATVALPFFVLSATGPMLQNWFRYREGRRSPYHLYAVSNAGSLLGLLSYPFLIEWVFTIRHQAWLWAAGFGGFAILCAITVSKLTDQREGSEISSEDEKKVEGKPQRSHYALWIALSACSTTMLLATTNMICLDLAVIPLLWVLPLCIYLGSYILAFGRRRWYRRSVFWPLYFLMLGVELKTIRLGYHLETPLQIRLLAVALFVVCMVCHGELSLTRPAPQHLTWYLPDGCSRRRRGRHFCGDDRAAVVRWTLGISSGSHRVRSLAVCGVSTVRPERAERNTNLDCGVTDRSHVFNHESPEPFSCIRRSIPFLSRPEIVGSGGSRGRGYSIAARHATERRFEPDEIRVAIIGGIFAYRGIWCGGVRLRKGAAFGSAVSGAQFLWNKERRERERTYLPTQRQHDTWKAI